MKKTVAVEKATCDVCGEDAPYGECDECGRDYCYDCRKTRTKEYPHSVYCTGSGDGRYCIECDAALIREGDEKHKAYRQIAFLRAEADLWGTNFKQRYEAAEKTLKALQK